MIDVPKLRGRIVEKGFSYKKMGRVIGKSEKTFGKKMKRGVFDTDEIEAMIVALEIENPLDYFFIKRVT